MSHLVEFPLAAGGTVLVQVTTPGPDDRSDLQPDEAPVTRGRLREQPDALTERASQTLDAALAAVQPAAESLLSTLTDLSRVPDEISVEFAVELSAHAGAFIATLGSTANFKIALKWRRSDPTLNVASP
jgi:Trypsin-co-occurring domain 1